MRRAKASGQCRDISLPGSACFLQYLHFVERTIRCLKQGIDGCTIFWIDSHANAHGKQRLLAIAAQSFADPFPDERGIVCDGFRKDDRKFVPAIPRGRIDRAAGKTENIGQAAKRPIAGQMAIDVVDLLHPVQIKHEHGKGPRGAIRALDLGFEFLAQSAVVCQAGQGVGRSQMAEMIFRRALCGDVFGNDLAALRRSFLSAYLSAAEPDFLSPRNSGSPSPPLTIT